MSYKKKFLLLLATAALMTACGGGGGDTTGLGGGDSDGGITNPDTGNNPDTGSNPDTVNNPPDNSDDGTIPSNDQQLNGYLQISANQLVFIPADRKQMYGYSYNGSPIEYFEETGLEIASGGTESDMGAEIPPSAIAPAAPIANFGFRVLNEVQSDAGGIQAGVQTAVGRVALDFVERADSAGILAGERPERMTFIIDQVELSTDAGGRLVSSRALENAKVYVTGVNAAGTAVRDTIAAPADSVRLMPLYHVADNYGDTTAQVLMVDPEQAFSQAGERLSALHTLRGEFDMHLTMSPVKMVRPSKPVTDEPALERRDLVGRPIEMTNHVTVNGSGVSGRVWIRRNVN
jgi:hypothetical protein